MKRPVGILFSLILLTTFLLAQSDTQAAQSAQARVQKELDSVQAAYDEHDYSHIIPALRRVLAMPEMKQLPDWRPNLLLALAGMYVQIDNKRDAFESLREATRDGGLSYAQLVSNEDLINLYGTPELESIAAELRRKDGIGPLAWEHNDKTSPFAMMFEAPDVPQYKEMRTEFKIDEALKSAKNDLARLEALARWTSAQWEHNSMQMASHTDPLTILREAKKGGKFICMNYAVVLSGTAQAYGMPARVLALAPRDIDKRADSHSVVEVWLADQHKWAIADAQYGIVPTVEGRPLNAVELQDALVHGHKVECGETSRERCAYWSDWIVQHLYHFKVWRDQRWYSRGQDGTQLVLLPKGAPEPKLYNGQDTGMFANAVFTRDPDVFYAAPK